MEENSPIYLFNMCSETYPSLDGNSYKTVCKDWKKLHHN